MLTEYNAPFVIGMDGGGTKTKACAADLDGHVFDTVIGASMNINSQGREGVLQNMAAIYQTLQQHGARWENLKALCLGAAGVSNPLTRETLTESALTAGILVTPIIFGDHQAALYGAHGKGKGMILIAGTGSICYGVDGEGREARTGGWGHLIDDEGSGYALGRDILSAVVQAEDGRIPPTCMWEAVKEQLQIHTIQELIQFIYSPSTGKKEIAALAPIIMKGLEAGEEAADAILEKAADKLSKLVVPVAKKLHMEDGELAFCGSIITKNEALISKLTRKVSAVLPNLQCIQPKQDAAVGAVLRSLEDI